MLTVMSQRIPLVFAVLLCVSSAVQGNAGVNPRIKNNLNQRFDHDLTQSRKLQQQAASDVPLRVHLERSVLTSDARTCLHENAFVARGTPEGCGAGCQFASTLTGSSSEFIYQGVPTGAKVLGPPDVYPRAGDDRNAWAPAVANSGQQTIQFRINSAVYVTGLEVFETFHPGAVVRVEARNSQDQQPWDLLWQGDVSIPAGSSVYDANTGIISTTARVFRPPIKAPRGRRLDEFRITLDTDAVNGYNEIDAFKVLGDGEDGLPLDSFSPECSSLQQTDCYFACREEDLVDLDRYKATLDLTAQAVSWVSSVLKVAPMASARLMMSAPADWDEVAVWCNDVEVPQDLISRGAAAELILFVTSRPVLDQGAGYTDRMLPTSQACRFETSSAALGRPLAVQLNLPPKYAEEALNTGTQAQEEAVDGIIHHLYRVLGWGAEYHGSFLVQPGVDIVTCPNSPGTCDVNEATALWGQRNLFTVQTPRVMEKASAHFGASVPYVEFENGGGPGVQGVLLEDRIYHGEVMSFPAAGKKLYKSAISLALLEDTGWYFPTYAKAEALPWGLDQGRDFFTAACNLWPQSAAHYVCPTRSFSLEGVLFDSDRAGAESCVGDRLAKGVCRFLEHPLPLPGPYQYFRQPEQLNFGGEDALRDYCPWTQPLDGGLGLCTDLGNQVGGKYFEEFGASARCFEVVRDTVSSIGCLRHSCVDGKLYLKLGDEFVPCPIQGGEVFSQSLSITVSCPVASTLCDSYSQIPPAVLVNYPGSNTIVQPQLTAQVELVNFEVPRDGELRVTVGGRLHQTWRGGDDDINQDQQGEAGGLVKQVPLLLLPTGRLVLGFHLHDNLGKEIAVFKVVLNVVSTVSQWVSEVVSFTSEDPTRPASNLLGPNTTSLYQSSPASWSPNLGGTGRETVELKLESAVHASAVYVYENFASPGALRSVWIKDSQQDAGEGTVMAPLWAGGAREVDSTRPVLGSPYTPIEAGTRDGSVSSMRGDVVVLEFQTPPWVEVDAVRVVGTRYTPASLKLEGTEEGEAVPISVVTLRQGSSSNHLVRVENSGSSTLYWELAAPASFPAWLVPLNTTGVHFGQGSIELMFEVDSSLISGGQTAVSHHVQVVDTYGLVGETLVEFDLVLQVDYTLHTLPTPPVCYNGVVLGATDRLPGTCTCHPGAYGGACEFLRCPKNCSSTASDSVSVVGDEGEQEGETVLKRGTCDSFAGQCVCTAGYTGLDCSGQDGDCYISFDGKCRGGWEAGDYVLNTADHANLNKANGALPISMQCDASGDEWAFGCKQFVHMQFCCRAASPPSCPFLPGALPCQDQFSSCTADYTADPACLTAVHEHCFDRPEDPACNSFAPVPPPPSFCPSALAWEWCALHPQDQDCAPLNQSLAMCAFTEFQGWSPCSVNECVSEGVLSEACQPWVRSHCQQHPEDRECDLHGFADECLFRLGSAPCIAPECTRLPDAYDRLACDAVIDQYCGSITTGVTPDPECANQGYGSAAPEVTPSTPLACPWTAILKQCQSSPSDPACLQMHLVGMPTLPQDQRIPMTSTLDSFLVLQSQAQSFDTEAYNHFTEEYTDIENDRRVNICQEDIALDLWKTSNLNDDNVLTADEFDGAVKAASAVLRLNRAVSDTSSLSVMTDMLETISYGQYVTYGEWLTVVKSYFDVKC